MAGTTVRQYFGPSGKYYLDTQWSSSSNGSAANSSDVSVKVYVGAVGGWSAYTGGTNLTIKIDGSTVRSGSSSGVSINGSEQLMGTGSKTVGHSSDGSQSITIYVSFDGGSYLGTGTDSFTARLDTIPRKSTMRNDADWNAGSNFTVSLTRYSSSFRHEAEIYVKARSESDYTHVKQVAFNTKETSKSTDFSAAENKKLFEKMVGQPGADSYIIMQTYKGDDWIGSNYYYGTITAPDASTISTSKITITGSDSISINKSISAFNHTVQLKFGTHSGPVTGMFSGSSVTATYTAANVFSQIPNSKTIDCDIILTSYYEGVKVRNSVTKTVTATVVNSEPTFSESKVSYKDGVTSISSIMGTNPVTLVQNKSTLVVEITAANRALPVNGSTMKTYSASINGFTVTQNWSSSATVTFNMGAVDLSSNGTLVVKAKDSRGLETEIVKSINIVPYATPLISISADRQNNFDAPTSISVGGVFSLVKVGTTAKNSLVNIATTPIQIRYRENVSGGSFNAWESVSVPAPVLDKFQSTPVIKTLERNKTYVIETQVKDKFGTYTTNTVVAKGIPIFSIDTVKNSIGFKSIPTTDDVFEMFGKMVFDKNKYATGTTNDAPIDFSNSDAVGLNSLWFNDPADNDGEGLQFPKTNASVDKTKPFSKPDWNNFRIMDDIVYLDNKPMYMKNAKLLWTGTSFGSNSGEAAWIGGVNALDHAPNGVFFVFADVDYATGGNSTYNDFNWVYVPVPRYHFENFNGTGVLMGVPTSNTNSGSSGSYANKYFYVSRTGFTGHADNNSGPIQLDVALRAVITY